jgi:predicted AlkP superfamily phosphohydrolase/phosphomutase/Tfp pilus assembly protein PilF
MPESRVLRFFITLALMAAVMYALISLFLPSSRRLIFGVDKRTGTVRTVNNSITFLPPHQFYRLSFDKREGSAQRDGVIRIISKDGVPVRVTYRLRFGVSNRRIPDAPRLVAEGWSSWIRARVTEAVSAVTSQIPLEELVSPTSQFNSRRDRLRDTVARHLAESGLNVTAFEIARLDVDRDALLRSKRMELRRDARGIIGRVVVLGIDGLDWELLAELKDDGRIPNLEALIKGGTTASVQTIQPTIEPMLWTTVATGLSPDRHGVIDFTDRERSGAPVDSTSRRVPALWDISDAFNRPTQVVNWWTAWPPTDPNGVFFDTPVELMPRAIYPATLAGRVTSTLVPESTVGYPQVRRFLNITEAEFDKEVNGSEPNNPIVAFRSVLAKTWTDHRTAIDLFALRRPLLTMVSYEGTDTVNHLFGPYHPPLREDVDADEYRKYWPTVSNYYAEIDRLIGEWMRTLPEDTTVVIMSSHGHRWGKVRAKHPPKGAALSEHRAPGVFIAYGAHVLPSRSGHVLSIYDVAPAVLALLGLPQSDEMTGHFPDWLFRDVQQVKSVRVVSYAEFVGSHPLPVTVREPALAYTARLQQIGHLNDPNRSLSPLLEEDEEPQAAAPLSAERWGQYAYSNNLGVQLRKQNKTREAVEAFQQAIEINPSRPVPYLNLAMTYFDKQQYTAADEAFTEAVTKGLPSAERYFIDFAALYRQSNMPSRAVNLLMKGRALFPQSYPIAANLGSALVQSERYTEGLAELERALGLQPSSTLVLNNLGLVYAKRNDFGRALDYWNRSLSIEPHQPEIRQALVAVASRL